MSSKAHVRWTEGVRDAYPGLCEPVPRPLFQLAFHHFLLDQGTQCTTSQKGPKALPVVCFGDWCFSIVWLGGWEMQV